MINSALQDHKNILFSGVSQPDRLVKTIKFKICSIDESVSSIEPFFDVIEERIKLFEHILEELNIKH